MVKLPLSLTDMIHGHVSCHVMHAFIKAAKSSPKSIR